MSSAKVNWEQCLKHAALTDVGMRRANNQDSHAVMIADGVEAWSERGHIFMVADGMGAHAAGELASKIAADNIPFLYHKYRDQSPPEALQRAVLETNAEINRRGKANSDFHNMGTTCTVLVLLPQGALAAHIGDSRAYRLRGEVIEQLTFDHSMVWEMRAAGQLPEGELARSIPKNVITRSLGPHVNVQCDVEGPFPIEVGDTFLLCSDGLSGQVEDDEIGAILSVLAPKEAAQVLVDLANLRGGPDNSTVLIAKIVGPELSTAASRAEPLTIGADKNAPAVHPGLWIGVGVCFLAALVLWMVMQNQAVGLAAAVAGVIVLGIALLMQFSGGRSGTALVGGKRLGKGPYVQVPCAPGPTFVTKLSETINKMRETATERQFHIEWTKVNDICAKAEDARQAGRNAEAVRDYSRAISLMMQELRSHNKKKASDSSVL
jgi:serine/threonine protein phosphatase PrpC